MEAPWSQIHVPVEDLRIVHEEKKSMCEKHVFLVTHEWDDRNTPLTNVFVDDTEILNSNVDQTTLDPSSYIPLQDLEKEAFSHFREWIKLVKLVTAMVPSSVLNEHM